MAENVEFTKVDGVLIPNKLLAYAKHCLPEHLRPTALNYYLIFGRQTPQTVMDMLEKYQNIFCQNFPIDNLTNNIGTEAGVTAVFDAIERYLSGKVMGADKRIVFEIFKPWIHAYMDPAYILYNLSFRRPRAYKIIVGIPGGFEWVRNICETVRERYGMNNPAAVQYMMDPWEMKALMPSSAAVADNVQKR